MAIYWLWYVKVEWTYNFINYSLILADGEQGKLYTFLIFIIIDFFF